MQTYTKTLIALRRKRKFKRALFITLMLIYPITQFLVFWFYVNINTVIISFRNLSYTTGNYEWYGFKNYANIIESLKSTFNDGILLRKTVFNSLILFPFNNFLLLPVSIICAYILFQRVFMHRVFRVVFFLPSIISIVVLTMVFRFMFDSTFGPINSILRAMGLDGLIPQNGWLGTQGLSFNMILIYCLWAGIGFNVVLLTGAISRIPQEIFEAGRIDGIKMGRELFSVVLPLIFPTVSTLFIFGATVPFTLFLQPKLLTAGGPNGMSQTVGFMVITLVEHQQLERAASLGLFFTVIAVPFIWIIKYVMDKITPSVEF